MSRGPGNLLVTGVPGWLTAAFLRSIRAEHLPGLTSIRCLVEPHLDPQQSTVNGERCGVEYVSADLRDTAALRSATQGIDSVLHAAGILHVRRTDDWYQINTHGTRNLVWAAVQAGVRRFVFISSNAAAGRSPDPQRLLTETDSPSPLSHYGRSKWLAEKHLAGYGKVMETVVLRPCMFYGPPVPARHVDIYQRLISGRMPLIGQGNYARSLTYVDHLVQACRLALTHPAAAGQTYFISDLEPYTTKEVTDAMAQALGVSARYLKLPDVTAKLAYKLDLKLAECGLYWQALHLAGEADWNVGVSCEKARTELGYEPAISLNEGMKRAVAWC